MLELLEHHLKPVKQNNWSQIKVYVDISKKIANVGNVPQNAILVTAYAVGLYPDVPHKADLKAVHKMLEVKQHKAIFTEDLFKMARFCLRKQLF